MDGVVGREREGADGGVDGGDGFLVAVAMKLDRSRSVGEEVGRDVSGVDFAGEKFVEHEAVRSHGAGGAAEVGRDEVGIFVAESEDGRGFNADERFIGGNATGEAADVFFGKRFCATDEALRE